MPKNIKKKPKQRKSLAETHPKLSKEADGWDAANVSSSSGKKLPWKCNKGHRWEAIVSNRSKGNGCPVCAGQLILAGFNDFKTLFPEIASQAHGWEPSMFRPGSNQKKEWQCQLGHIWLATPNERTGRHKTGCPFCSNVKVLPGFNDLKTKFPEVAKEAYEWDASQHIPGSHMKMTWRCKLGHIYTAGIKQRCYGETNCPYCSGNKVLAGFNDLKTIAPVVASQADGWDATRFSKGSNGKKSWKCAYGHKWKAEISSRVNLGTGCPYCSGKNVEIGFNDLETRRPDVATQAFGWNPTEYTEFSGEKMDWICSLGHIWKSRIADRTSGKGCPICSGNKVLTGFNDLLTTHPQLASEGYGWDATKYSFGSGSKLEWKCSEGHIWRATISNRVNGKGCPHCAKFGFDTSKPGYLYLLFHTHWQMHKIGISNSEKQRTERHESSGWELLEIRGPMDGLLAYEWEQSILKLLRKKGADLGNSTVAGTFDGYTESWVASSFPVKSIKELMQLVQEDEDNPTEKSLGGGSDSLGLSC